jgi:hypothetical protein
MTAVEPPVKISSRLLNPRGRPHMVAGPRTGPDPGLSQSWGSCGYSHRRVRIVGGMEALSEAGAESTIIDGASNLKQQIGAAS